MMLFILAVYTSALLLLAIFSVRLWRNLYFLRDARGLSQLSDEPPRVSILVPARDEARTIADCINSLARQNYPNFEVIALDDQSSDETGTLLDGLATQHKNLIVLHGNQNPPAGWNGKSYACQRLAERAAGEWLLFTDADTHHNPTSIGQGIAQAEGLGVDLLSVFPKQITVSWSERIMVSFILDFLPLIGLDLTNLWRTVSGGVAANGQYLLVRASTYHAIGGHRAISQALVDDFALAKRVRAHGHKIALVDGTKMLNCRMYYNACAVWNGFSKNILLALETSSDQKRAWWWGMLFAWGYACLFVLPFCLLFFGGGLLSLMVVGWLMLLRGVVNCRLSRSWIEVPLTPLAAWSLMALGISAFLRRRSGKQIRWKSREYPAIN